MNKYLHKQYKISNGYEYCPSEIGKMYNLVNTKILKDVNFLTVYINNNIF